MGVNPDARSNKAQVADQAARCFELQLSGMTIRGIAAETGLAKSTVEARLKMAYAAVLVPPVEEMRKREGERLLHLLSKLQPAVDAGDQDAIRMAMRLSESYRRLFGLNAPEQHQLQIHQATQQDLELIDLINAERAKVHAEEQQLKES